MIRHLLPGLAALALIAATAASHAEGLTARISADKIAVGDTFQLTLSADAAKLTVPPDVSALNADFDILGTSRSSQTRIINGARSDTVEWVLTLAPRGKGHMTIPVLTAGKNTSEPLTLDVVDAADLPADRQQGGTAMSATLEPGNHYVQQEIPLSLRITTGPGFQGGSVTAPESPDYILEQRGEDRVSQTTANGQPSTVIERDYLLRPQKSGTLTIAPFTLRATESDPSARSPFPQDPFANFFGQSPFGATGSPFDRLFNPGHEIVVRTAPLTLEVKANPSASAGWFLPAKAVTLSAEWEPKAPAFRVGEAVTRHIRIQALGATEVQLPDLAQPAVDGARVYLDKSDAGSIDTPDGTAAIRDFTYSVVPTTGGKVTLPAVTVNWFDTDAESARVATLAAETITVSGAVAAAPAKAVALPEPAEIAPAASMGRGGMIGSGWIAALAVAVLETLSGLYLARRRLGRARNAHGQDVARDQRPRYARRKAALRKVEVACAAADPNAAYPAALEWLRAASLARRVEDGSFWRNSPDLHGAWNDLEARVFSEQTEGGWNAPLFLQHLRSADRQVELTARRPTRSALPPLYASSQGGRGQNMTA